MYIIKNSQTELQNGVLKKKVTLVINTSINIYSYKTSRKNCTKFMI